ncbi:MAG: extracellular solute-binding protein, partial [Candidatus Tectomicrobia bacterium]|nr:extracellular solute-binding protein [Candidatus Tectomicrobia bacterium]
MERKTDRSQKPEETPAEFYASQNVKSKAEFEKWIDFAKENGAVATAPPVTRSDLGEEFEKQHPHISVRFHPTQSYNKILYTVLKLAKHQQNAGVFVAEISELLTLKDAGAILRLDELVDSEAGGREQFLAPFIQGFLSNSYGDDKKLYALPLFRSTPIIYYNMTILQDAGISLSQLPATWEELEKTLKIIKGHTGKVPFGLAGTWYDWLFESFVRQNGGALANATNPQVEFDHPTTIETLAFWKTLHDKGLMKRVKGAWKAAINGFVSFQT